jgi:aminopeptidase N
MRIAHEVAHQWWYNMVGSDPVNRPWLDEGLAEYATYFYREKTRGKEAADLLAAFLWETAVAYARKQGLDTVVDQPVEAFQSNNYETMVYGKAALFFNALHQAMGEERFLQLLRRYVSDYRFKIATPEDFLALAEEMAGDTAIDLYRQYILEPEAVPLPVD